MTAEELLAELFEGRVPADRNCYALNVALGLKPWWPPLQEVWRSIDAPPPPGQGAAAQAWPEAVALLQQLHGEFRKSRRRTHATRK